MIELLQMLLSNYLNFTQKGWWWKLFSGTTYTCRCFETGCLFESWGIDFTEERQSTRIRDASDPHLIPHPHITISLRHNRANDWENKHLISIEFFSWHFPLNWSREVINSETGDDYSSLEWFMIKWAGCQRDVKIGQF